MWCWLDYKNTSSLWMRRKKFWLNLKRFGLVGLGWICGETKRKLQLPASHRVTPQQTRRRQQLGDRVRKEKRRARELGAFSFHISGGFLRCEGAEPWLRTRKWSASPKSWIKWCTRKTRWVWKAVAASAEKHAIRWWALPSSAEGKILETRRRCFRWGLRYSLV